MKTRYMLFLYFASLLTGTVAACTARFGFNTSPFGAQGIGGTIALSLVVVCCAIALHADATKGR